MGAVEKRLREELAELQVEINEEKSRIADLRRGESFGFLGFDFRRVRSRRGVWCAQYTPNRKKTNGAAAEAQGCIPPLPIATCGSGHYIDLGSTALAISPEALAKLVAEDTEKYGKVIRAANIKAE